MNNRDFITASIVTYNNGDKAATICKQLIEFTKKYPLRLYVIDNNSTDNTVELLNHIGGITLIKNSKNNGFGKGHNSVLKQGIGKYHFIINPDIEISYDVLSAITDFMEQNKNIVMLNPTVLNPDGSEQRLPKEKPTFKRLFLGRIFPHIRKSYTWYNRVISDVTDVNFCSGCFLCIKGDAFEALGGFDERYFMYLEDADLTLRAQSYGGTVTAPQFSVTHLWQRESAKKIKLLLIHISSSLKFLIKWRKNNETTYNRR